MPDLVVVQVEDQKMVVDVATTSSPSATPAPDAMKDPEEIQEVMRTIPRIYQNEMLALAEQENVIVLADTVL